MRAAFDDLPWNLHIGGSEVVAVDLTPAARVLRDTAGLWRIGFVPRRVPVGRPLPGVADHVVQPVTVRRGCRDPRRAFQAVRLSVLAGKIALSRIGHVYAQGGAIVSPREFFAA